MRAGLAGRAVPSVTVWSMSVTDAALVERCLDQIVAVDVGPVW